MKGQDKTRLQNKTFTNLVLAPCSIVAPGRGYNSLVCRAETLHLLSPAARMPLLKMANPIRRYFHVRHAIYVKFGACALKSDDDDLRPALKDAIICL